MKSIFCIIVLMAANHSSAFPFPLGPSPTLTPGSFCKSPKEFRYEGRIPICAREVTTQTKWEVIEAYNRIGATQITAETRAQYKVDHYIPLCMGGGNHPDNLWPQHLSVSDQTDYLECILCASLKTRKMNHAYALMMLKKAKNNLTHAEPAVQFTERILGGQYRYEECPSKWFKNR